MLQQVVPQPLRRTSDGPCSGFCKPMKLRNCVYTYMHQCIFFRSANKLVYSSVLSTISETTFMFRKENLVWKCGIEADFTYPESSMVQPQTAFLSFACLPQCVLPTSSDLCTFWPDHRTVSFTHSLGICSDLETIQHPCAKNNPTTGCTSKMDSFAPIVPSGIDSCVQLCEAQNAISATMLKLVGIGKPSKYAALPLLSFGTLPVVTLKRANRASPARTNTVRKSWSSGVLRPRANAAAPGATPKDI